MAPAVAADVTTVRSALLADRSQGVPGLPAPPQLYFVDVRSLMPMIMWHKDQTFTWALSWLHR